MSGIYEGEKQGEAEQAAAPAIVVPEYGGVPPQQHQNSVAVQASQLARLLET